MAGINALDEDGRTVLHSTKGDVSDLLDAGANPNIQDEGGWSPLTSACSSGDYDKVRSLLVHPDINVNLRTEAGTTGLHYAASKGFNDILTLLLQREEIDLNIQDHHSKNTPLMRAVSGGHILCARRLVERGCRVNSKDVEGNTALHRAVAAENLDLVLFLVSNRARMDEPNREDKTPLDIASPFIRYRLEEEAD